MPIHKPRPRTSFKSELRSVWSRVRKYAPSSAERSTIFSSIRTRSAVLAMAQPIGLPPKVLPWSPGLYTLRISRDARTAETG